MPPGIRKHASGYEKRKKKQRIEELTKSQKGAIDKFILKQTSNSRENEKQSVSDDNPCLNDDDNVNNANVDDGNVDDGNNAFVR